MSEIKEKNDRYLKKSIHNDALHSHKMAFISGPRQVGKTTLGRSLLNSKANEFNWDDKRFKIAWAKDPRAALSQREGGPVLLDEIHKDRKWKTHLKGVYDLDGEEMQIIVTGSARLDYYRKGGDSLMGRYFPYRLNPFTVAETPNPISPEDILKKNTLSFPWNDLLEYSGFPEPLFESNSSRALRWSNRRLERLMIEDVRDFRNIQNLHSLRLLADLLPERVGSLLSINTLREIVSVAHGTLSEWLKILEALYHCFLIKPYATKLSRALTSEPKLYLYDILQIEDRAARQENLAALHLLKACQYWTDLSYGEFDLRFIRNKEKQEIDFLVTRNKKPWMLVECKSGKTSASETLRKFSGQLGTTLNFQLVSNPGFDKFYPHDVIRVMSYEKFFGGIL